MRRGFRANDEPPDMTAWVGYRDIIYVILYLKRKEAHLVTPCTGSKKKLKYALTLCPVQSVWIRLFVLCFLSWGGGHPVHCFMFYHILHQSVDTTVYVFHSTVSIRSISDYRVSRNRFSRFGLTHTMRIIP